MPTWYDAINLGEWGTLPNSILTGSGADEVGAYETILAWGGAILNTVGVYIGATWTPGTFLVIFGGGHTDSGLNAVYAYGPLENDAPIWHRLRDSTSPAPQNEVEDANGNPVSRHTYNGLAYDPASNLMYVGGAFRYTDAGDPGFWTYDFGVSAPNTNQPWTLLIEPSLGPRWQISAWDSVNAVLWTAPSTAILNNYTPATATWNTHQFKSGTFTTNPTSCIDTGRGIWQVWSGANGALNFYQTNNGTANQWWTPTTTGTAPTVGTGGYGSMLYDPVDDRLVVWANSGKDLWVLTPPATSPYSGGNAWAWSAISPSAGATPTLEAGLDTSAPGESAGTGVGTFGRFAYYGTSRGYLLLNRASDSIYFFRPASAAAGGGATQFLQSLAGALASAGSLSRRTDKSLAGTTPSIGVAQAIKTALIALAGTLLSSGALSRRPSKSLSGATASAGTIIRRPALLRGGDLASSGALTKETRMTLAGVLASSGVVQAIRTVLVHLAGTLASGGRLSRQAGKAMAGTLSSSGSLAKRISLMLAGVTASAGALVKRTALSLAGAVSSAGTLTSRKLGNVIGYLVGRVVVLPRLVGAVKTEPRLKGEIDVEPQ